MRLLRRSLCVLFALTLLPTARSQEKAPDVFVACTWTVGTKNRYEWRMHGEEFIDGRKVNSTMYAVPVEVEVVQKTEAGYVLHWSYGVGTFTCEPDKGPSIEAMARINDESTFRWRTDARGQLVQLVNREEIALRHRKRAPDIFAAMGTPNDLPMLKKMQEDSLRTFVNGIKGERVQDEAIEVLAPIFAGCDLRKNAAHDCKGHTFRNPLIGKRLPACVDWSVSESDAGGDTITLTRRKTLDSKKALPLIQTTLKESKLLPRGVTPETAAGIELVSEEGTVAYDAETGFPHSASLTRTVLAGSRKEVEVTTLRRLDDEAK